MKGIIASLDDIVNKYDNINNNDDDSYLYDDVINNYSIERVHSNTGTIINSFDKSFFIADAKYRTKKSFRDSEVEPNGNLNIRLPMLNNFRAGYFNNFRDDFSSKENTDGIIQIYGDHSPAVNYVRSLIIPELGPCDLPSFSLFETLNVFSGSIDKLDSSLRFKKYQKYSLTNLFSKDNFYITSTCYSRVSNHGTLVCHKFILAKGNRRDFNFIDRRTDEPIFRKDLIVIPIIEL